MDFEHLEVTSSSEVSPVHAEPIEMFHEISANIHLS